jgi:membrane protease YdiL (CAAX protease family)
LWWRLFFVPVAKAAGFPPIVGLLVGMLFGLSAQLGYLLWLGWKRNRRLSLAGVVVYRYRLPRWQYPLYAVATVAWGAVVTFAATPIESAILKTVFGWVPAGFSATTAADAASHSVYPRTILLITFGSLILINGVAAPIVEELYFRGYLMPRISRFRWKTRSWRTPSSPSTTSGSRGLRDHPAYDDLLHRSGLSEAQHLYRSLGAHVAEPSRQHRFSRTDPPIKEVPQCPTGTPPSEGGLRRPTLKGSAAFGGLADPIRRGDLQHGTNAAYKAEWPCEVAAAGPSHALPGLPESARP